MTSISHRIRYFFSFDENYTAHFPNNLTDDEPDRVLQESIESEMYFPFVDTIVGNLTIKELGLTIIDISESTNEDPRNPVEFLLYEKNRNQIFKLAFELWMFDFRRSPSARFETPETYCQMASATVRHPLSWISMRKKCRWTTRCSRPNPNGIFWSIWKRRWR